MRFIRHIFFSPSVLFFLVLVTLFFSSCQGGDHPDFYTGQLNIVYADEPTNLSPLSYDAKDRRFLTNVYESLLHYDSSFGIETALAVSWGRLDDETWEFHLREGVRFHDGGFLTAEDVVYSLNLARQDKSDLGVLLSSVIDVIEVDDFKVQILTRQPDPLLLHKLTNVFIVPNEYVNFEVPLGTGSYRIFEFSNESWRLERFEDYWGPLAYFEEAHLSVISSPEDRLQAAIDGELQFLANVPPQYVDSLKDLGMEVAIFPSLEVSFLMFNMEGVFANDDLRAAAWLAFENDYADDLGGGYLTETDQFAASGIFGFIPQLEPRKRDAAQALELRQRFEGDVTVTLDVPQGLGALGEKVANDLAVIDIQVEVNELPIQAYEDLILSGDSEFYFFGWKYDLADAIDFFEAVAHSKEGDFGVFNGLNYSNLELDANIELASGSLDLNERRDLFAEMTRQLLDDQVILPLFESRVIYGLVPEIKWNIRLDGLILASEIIGNVL